MTVIVKHRKSGDYYLLVGTGYGAYKATRSSFIGGDLFPHDDEGSFEVAAVSDGEGEIHWFPTEELQVIEVDGENPKDILNKFTDIRKKELEKERAQGIACRCPACNEEISIKDRECPSCGIRFVD